MVDFLADHNGINNITVVILSTVDFSSLGQCKYLMHDMCIN